MERSITPDNSTVGAGELQSGNKQGSSLDGTLRKEIKVELMEELLEGARPDAMEAAIGAAFQVTQNAAEAQKAALVGTLASHAMERAHAEEATVDRLLMELLDQRMEKLEHRVSLLEDVEGMLEAERRVALEIERRDLYTARCRHWFGNGN
jgi:SWI/SNF related-matrix-associated actin-dependent regulator of chromatin subfamily C